MTRINSGGLKRRRHVANVAEMKQKWNLTKHDRALVWGSLKKELIFKNLLGDFCDRYEEEGGQATDPYFQMTRPPMPTDFNVNTHRELNYEVYLWLSKLNGEEDRDSDEGAELTEKRGSRNHESLANQDLFCELHLSMKHGSAYEKTISRPRS